MIDVALNNQSFLHQFGHLHVLGQLKRALSFGDVLIELFDGLDVSPGDR